MSKRINIRILDHFVLTVADINASLHFYVDILGMEKITFGEGRYAVSFGMQKINFHEKGKEISPHAHSPVCGSADLCFITDTPLDDVEEVLRENDVPLILSKVIRTGALGRLLSTYVRDPDGNLVEISNRLFP